MFLTLLLFGTVGLAIFLINKKYGRKLNNVPKSGGSGGAGGGGTVETTTLMTAVTKDPQPKPTSSPDRFL